MDDEQIQKAAMRASLGGHATMQTTKSRRSLSSAGGDSMQGGPKSRAASSKEMKNNDWIPTQAVRAILAIKERFNGMMSETCVSQILYELNTIWRDIMRKENNAIKKRLTA